ncbi:tripartite tricarboxylate transporter TctB family protein [Noviherbaspirillum massiliense]|uniref:tripartite tricarboxylate transporter TctB family protein n=1 Tax=Noviherbaspirillum massiliense TaxID=1465823 RepID=UPI0002EEFA80|nr:tripartite tricarboxylate transporter TctB family protein [Noviherbaspirillum massiliense]
MKVPAWRAPLVVGLVLLILAVMTLTDSFKVSAGAGPGVGPAVAMKLIAALLGLLGVAHLMQAWQHREKQTTLAGEDVMNPGALAWVLGGLIVQIVALSLGAGFILAATILFVSTARGFGRPIKSLGPVYGFVLSVAVYAFFTKILSLTLPAGPLERLLLG